jgi:hypothetical protein
MTISAFPEEIYSSNDFGGDTIYAEPAVFHKTIEDCINNSGFDEDFDPAYKVWELIDDRKGIYKTVVSHTADGKWHHSHLRKSFIRDGDYWMEGEDFD